MRKIIIPLAFMVVIRGQRNHEPCYCGLSNRVNFGKTDVDSNRIIGGKETEVNEYPWQVLFTFKKKNGRSSLCGGSLVSNSWILTAAHCFKNGKAHIDKIYLGEHNRKIKFETKTIVMNSFDQVIHPNYSK